MISLSFKQQSIETTTPFQFKENTLYIPENKVYDEPIKIDLLDEHIQSLKIIVGKLTQANIILDATFLNSAGSSYDIELILEPSTHVKYLIVGEIHSKQSKLNHHFSLKKDANLKLIGAFISYHLDAFLNISLLEQGSSVDIKTITLTSQDHHQNLDATITHYAKDTFGDMTHVGIVNEQASMTINGVGKIEKGMKNANAFQTLKGIILSDQAVCEVNPMLLIDEFDVKAGHGATIGKIEADQLYYLMSRGLTKKEAEKLIIHGYLKPIIDEMDDETLKDRFIKLTNERL